MLSHPAQPLTRLLAARLACALPHARADGQPDYATCFQVFDRCIEDHTLFQQILTPYTQTLGLAHGWLFDPDRMKPLVDNKVRLGPHNHSTAVAPQVQPPQSCHVRQHVHALAQAPCRRSSRR